jgi:hypothetical protein
MSKELKTGDISPIIKKAMDNVIITNKKSSAAVDLETNKAGSKATNERWSLWEKIATEFEEKVIEALTHDADTVIKGHGDDTENKTCFETTPKKVLGDVYYEKVRDKIVEAGIISKKSLSIGTNENKENKLDNKYNKSKKREKKKRCKYLKRRNKFVYKMP